MELQYWHCAKPKCLFISVSWSLLMKSLLVKVRKFLTTLLCNSSLIFWQIFRVQPTNCAYLSVVFLFLIVYFCFLICQNITYIFSIRLSTRIHTHIKSMHIFHFKPQQITRTAVCNPSRSGISLIKSVWCKWFTKMNECIFKHIIIFRANASWAFTNESCASLFITCI